MSPAVAVLVLIGSGALVGYLCGRVDRAAHRARRAPGEMEHGPWR